MNVSNKALRAYINYLIEKEDNPKEFFESLGHNYSDILDDKNNISWQSYQQITEALNLKFDDFYHGMTKHGLSNKYVSYLLGILSRVISFRSVGEFILKYSFHTFYRGIEVSLEEINARDFNAHLKFENKESIFPVFIEMYIQVFQALPNQVDQAYHWEVRSSISDDTLTFHIRETSKKKSVREFLHAQILKLLKIDKYYQELIIKNIRYNNELEKRNIELERAQEETRQAHQRVLQINRIISHDIGNKMVSIEHVRRLIKRGQYERAQNKLDSFYKSVKGIIDNTRYVIRRSSVDFILKDYDLKEVLEETIFEYSEHAQEKQIDLLLSFDLKPRVIRTNKAALKINILGNIIHNAIKFSKPNSQIVLRASENESKLVIECQDHGIGLSDKAIDSINNTLHDLPLSTAGTNNEAGSGLGLQIIKEVAKELGFEVKYSTNSAKGTTVSLTQLTPTII